MVRRLVIDLYWDHHDIQSGMWSQDFLMVSWPSNNILEEYHIDHLFNICLLILDFCSPIDMCFHSIETHRQDIFDHCLSTFRFLGFRLLAFKLTLDLCSSINIFTNWDYHSISNLLDNYHLSSTFKIEPLFLFLINIKNYIISLKHNFYYLGILLPWAPGLNSSTFLIIIFSGIHIICVFL